ncbi:heavy metal-associated isoprenylated plant protein 8-like [Cucurbita moschata]|uniref:Heavy metal-associated isoprenylated plant protein 8-like n=1 Tax=Cucurbita moschata TaxID=3662 RepID=A0A6J1GPB4_CUCMO|nr:heavy metal-associated isoprenylated plant protein 8-like [Cucurbita moschata]
MKEILKGENVNGNKKQEEEKKEGKKITEVVLKVYMHCESCKTKVSKYLRGCEGVEEVTADVGNAKVVIKGKDLKPNKILEQIRRKYSKNAQLISPKPLPETPNQTKADPPKKEEVKTVELKMGMHCEGCVNDIKQRVGRMEGVMAVEADRESSKVRVKGIVDPPKLVEAIKKKMKKNVEVVNKKQEKEEKSANKPGGGGGGNNNNLNNQDGKQEKENLAFKYPPQYSLHHIYPNQTFSDDNVFSCSIM